MMPLKIQNDWDIREALPEELSFIYATWLNSFQADSFIGNSCRKTIFFQEYPKILDQILSRLMTKVLIAAFPESPNVILSYLVYEGQTLHYLFTKEVYRKHGIAESLVLEAFSSYLKTNHPIYFSHRTLSSESILEKHRAYLTYNPFKLYKSLEGEDHGRSH